MRVYDTLFLFIIYFLFYNAIINNILHDVLQLHTIRVILGYCEIANGILFLCFVIYYVRVYIYIYVYCDEF